MDKAPLLCLSAYPSDPQGSDEDQMGRSAGHPHRPGMAQTTLVLLSPGHVNGDVFTAPITHGLVIQGLVSNASPEPYVAAPDSLNALWLNPEELVCLEEVQEDLMGSRKPSTSTTYLAKWKRFSIWCSQQ